MTSGNYVTQEGILVEELPQVWNPATGQYRNLNSALKGLETYPFIFADPTVNPAGAEAFYAGPVTYENQGNTFSTWRLSTDDPGAWTPADALKKYHTSGSAVLYQPIKDTPGKILVLAGSAYDRIAGEPDAYDVVESFDLSAQNPAWTTVQPLTYARKSQNATLLPDGTVLVTGGYNGPGIDPPPSETGSVRTPELWSPADPLNPSGTWEWTSLATSPQSRIYHSTAVLLPDARVLTTGGELGNSTQGETYSPPFLFKGPRPVISSAPSVVNFGQPFTIQTPSADSVFRITIVRLSSVTHSVNMNQRFLELNFTGGSGSYTVTAPASPGQCPPGHYLLFVINNVGVPSVGRMLQILPAGAPEVAMVCPANGGFVPPGAVKVSAEVRDAAVVERVKFYQVINQNETMIGDVQTCTVQACPDQLLRRHYAFTWNQPTPGPYTLKARAFKSTSPPSQVDSLPITVTVHSFPTATQPPTLSPTVTPVNNVHPYYSFPVTITGTATAPEAGAYISEMDIYHYLAGFPLRLIRRTATPASPTSIAYSWPQARSGLETEVWVIARDNFGCETSPLPFPSPDVVRFKIYGGALDTTFAPPSGADGIVHAVAVQSDGKVVIGGEFGTVNGTPRNRIARLKTDGTLDDTFNPNANGIVRVIVVQSDGKILLGGDFTTIGSTTTRNRIARLNTDGTPDSFDPNITGTANPTVNAIALQSNNKILIGGEFTTIGGATTRNRIARLNTDGTPDSFDSTGVNAAVNAIAFQSDGKIVIGGDFTAAGTYGVARLTTGGALDAGFNAGSGANGSVKAIAVQKLSPNADKIILAGDFTTINTTARSRIARLNPSGGLDTSFQNLPADGANGLVRCIAVQPDDKIVIGGNLTTLNSIDRRRIGRLLADGSLDDTFRLGDVPSLYDLAPAIIGPDTYVASLTKQADGLIVIGGNFTRYEVQGLTGNAILRRGVARIGGL